MASRLGLIVNPVAGLGGRVGLKGTDGEDTVRKALELGAEPQAHKRAVEALKHIPRSTLILTYPGAMGEEEAREAGFEPDVFGSIGAITTSRDTVRAASAMTELGVDLILFAGGDGTARDIYSAVGSTVPVLGVPSGVKIHSAVFAVNPRAAGQLAAAYLRGEAETTLAEVMDVDEDAFRQDVVSARLYGYMKTPTQPRLLQGGKEGSSPGEEHTLNAIAADVTEGMLSGVLYIIGPGTTTRPIADALRQPKTLLGVDAYRDRVIVARDANEEKLLELIKGPAKVIVTVIGGQGFILGRGNQQISPRVIRRVGLENLMVVASPGKLASLKGKPMRVDTGDAELDAQLRGYIRVQTGYQRQTIYKVE